MIVLPHPSTNTTSRHPPGENKVTTGAPVGASASNRKQGAQNAEMKSRKNQQSTHNTVKPVTQHKAETVDQFAGITIQGKTSNTAKTEHTTGTKSDPVEILCSLLDEEPMKKNVKHASKTKTDNTQPQPDEELMENKEKVKDASKTKTDNTQNKPQALLRPTLKGSSSGSLHSPSSPSDNDELFGATVHLSQGELHNEIEDLNLPDEVDNLHPPEEIVVPHLPDGTMHQSLSKPKKALGHNSSRQLDFNLSRMDGNDFHGHHFQDTVDVNPGTPLPNIIFEDKRGDNLGFLNCQVLDDRRGLWDQNNHLIHKKVLTHLETAFGIPRRLDDLGEDLPDTLDKAAVEAFFRDHKTLQAKPMQVTTETLVDQLNGLVPVGGVKTHKLSLLLILECDNDKIAVVHHRPTGVLFPTDQN